MIRKLVLGITVLGLITALYFGFNFAINKFNPNQQTNQNCGRCYTPRPRGWLFEVRNAGKRDIYFVEYGLGSSGFSRVLTQEELVKKTDSMEILPEEQNVEVASAKEIKKKTKEILANYTNKHFTMDQCIQSCKKNQTSKTDQPSTVNSKHLVRRRINCQIPCELRKEKFEVLSQGGGLCFPPVLSFFNAQPSSFVAPICRDGKHIATFYFQPASGKLDGIRTDVGILKRLQEERARDKLREYLNNRGISAEIIKGFYSVYSRPKRGGSSTGR